MRRLKTIHPSSVLNMDTDEFLVYNYLGDNEDPNKFLINETKYQLNVKKEREKITPVRKRLPALNEVSIGNFLANETLRPCIKVPGLQMSARESNLTDVTRNVPDSIDARIFMTLRHRRYGRKESHFTKCLIDLKRVPLKAIQQENVRTIHNPLARICGQHAGKSIGMDYMLSILRLNHYAGTVESFGERMNDSRKGRKGNLQGCIVSYVQSQTKRNQEASRCWRRASFALSKSPRPNQILAFKP